MFAGLLLAPFVISGVRAAVDGWLPSGDEALIAIKTHDVFTHNPPLVGQPSSSYAADGGTPTVLAADRLFTFHPGPIEFWLFALPVRLLGPRIGLLLGAGVINGGAVLVTAWVVLRRAGPGLAAWAAVVLAALGWSQGSALLTDPISSSLGGFSFLAFCTLTWALVAGDVRLLPLAVFAGTWTAQQHLANVAPVVIVAAWATVGLGVALARKVRAGDQTWLGAGRWIVAGLLAGAVLWAPVLAEQITGHPGNLTAIARFARADERPTLGVNAGIDQMLRSLGIPPLFLRPGWSGAALRAPLEPLATVGALLVVGSLVALGLWFRRRVVDLALLAATALVVAGAGVFTGANVPSTYLAEKINLYRWVWTAAALAWIALGWGAGRVSRRLAARGPRTPALGSRPGRPPINGGRHGAVVTVLVTALLGAASLHAGVAHGRDDQRRDAAAFGVERRTGAGLLKAVDRRGPWLVIPDGFTANMSVAPSLASQLVAAGVEVQVRAEAPYHGAHRRYRPGTVAGAILVRTGATPLTVRPGRQVHVESLNHEFDRAVERLLSGADLDREVVLASRSERLLDDLDRPSRARARRLLDLIDTEPRVPLGTPLTLRLIRDGYFSTPRFDPGDVARVLELAEDRRFWPWGDDHLGVWILSPPQLAAWERRQR